MRLGLGGLDLQADLRLGPGVIARLHPASHLVVASRSFDLEPPVDNVFANIKDLAGLRGEAEAMRDLGFYGKSVIHPTQIPVVHEVFTPTDEDVRWARSVVAAFANAGYAATRLDDGQFIDRPVSQRAEQILQMHARG